MFVICFLACKGSSDQKKAKDDNESAKKGSGAVCESIEECEKGCDAEKADHCVALGNLDLSKPRPAPADTEAAKKAFQSACDAGSQAGCAMVGHCLQQLDRTLAGGKKALGLFETACKKGEPLGCTLQGDVLEGVMVEGKYVVEKDHPRAMKLFQKACDDDFALGCVRLGVGHNALFESEGGDPKKAYKAFEKACSLGSQGGCGWQGLERVLGSGVEANVEEGVKLMETACAKGRPGFPDYPATSCDSVAEIYENGKYGVEASIKKAWPLYTRACSMGLDSSCAKGKELRKKAATAE